MTSGVSQVPRGCEASVGGSRLVWMGGLGDGA